MVGRLPPVVKTSERKTEWVKVFVYGGARTGKTNLLRELYKSGYEILILATELGDTKGLQTVSDLPIDSVECDSYDTLEAVAKHLVANKGKYANKQYNLVYLDSLTHGMELVMEKGMVVLGWDMVFGINKGDNTKKHNSLQVYGYAAEKGRAIMKILFEINTHLVVVAREGVMTIGEGQDQKSWEVPELAGQKLPRELPGWPDASLRLIVQNGQRRFVTQTIGNVIAGVRLPEGVRLPTYVNPSLSAIIKLVQGDASQVKVLTPQAGAVATTPPVKQPVASGVK